MLDAVGLSVERVEFLAQGSTSTAWKLKGGKDEYVLRKIEDDRAVDGEVDGFIRGFLRARGGRVAELISNSETVASGPRHIRWSLERFVPGVHPERSAVLTLAAAQLGETLAILHDVPVSNWGRPDKLSDGSVEGGRSTQLPGVEERFENPLPQTWAPGFEHPLKSVLPGQWEDILTGLAVVDKQREDGIGVMCHSDLHEKQLICRNGELAALIDFGEAVILDRHWDLGSVLYFHGADVFADFFSGYEAVASGEASTELAEMFAIAIAMHHASRSRLPGKEHRLQFAGSRVRNILGKLR